MYIVSSSSLTLPCSGREFSNWWTNWPCLPSIPMNSWPSGSTRSVIGRMALLQAPAAGSQPSPTGTIQAARISAAATQPPACSTWSESRRGMANARPCQPLTVRSRWMRVKSRIAAKRKTTNSSAGFPGRYEMFVSSANPPGSSASQALRHRNTAHDAR